MTNLAEELTKRAQFWATNTASVKPEIIASVVSDITEMTKDKDVPDFVLFDLGAFRLRMALKQEPNDAEIKLYKEALLYIKTLPLLNKEAGTTHFPALTAQRKFEWA